MSCAAQGRSSRPALAINYSFLRMAPTDWRQLNLLLEPTDHLVFQTGRAGLAKIKALREIDMAARLDPYSGKRVGRPGDGRNYGLGWHMRIMSALHDQRRD